MGNHKLSELGELPGTMLAHDDLLELVDVSTSLNKKQKVSSLLGRTDQETGASYTFGLDDAFKTKLFNSASAQVATVPANATVAFPIGARLRLFRQGAGSVKFVPDAGVTIRLPTGIAPKRNMAVHVKMSAPLGAANPSAGREITFNTDVYDTDAFHDTTTNTGRLTIPSGLGIKKVQINAQAYGLGVSSASYSHITLFKNGALAMLTGSIYQGGGAIPNLSKNGVSAWIGVADADYFQLYYYSNDTSNNPEADWTGFSLTVTEIDAQGFVAYQYGSVELQKIGTDEWIVIDQTALG